MIDLRDQQTGAVIRGGCDRRGIRIDWPIGHVVTKDFNSVEIENDAVVPAQQGHEIGNGIAVSGLEMLAEVSGLELISRDDVCDLAIVAVAEFALANFPKGVVVIGLLPAITRVIIEIPVPPKCFGQNQIVTTAPPPETGARRAAEAA